MEEKTYVLLVKKTKGSEWEQQMKPKSDRYLLENFAQAAQNNGLIFSAQVYEMPSEWLVFWI